jgi:hypothetical protein
MRQRIMAAPQSDLLESTPKPNWRTAVAKTKRKESAYMRNTTGKSVNTG